jgi:hypothetical protein
LFLVVVISLEQAVNNLWQGWWHHQTCHKVVLISLIQSWHNKNVTRLTTQKNGSNHIVTSWVYRTCWNNFATNLIISTRLLQVVSSLFHTCWQLGTSSADTTCWRLVGRLATRCEIFVCVIHAFSYLYCTCMILNGVQTYAITTIPNVEKQLRNILIEYLSIVWILNWYVYVFGKSTVYNRIRRLETHT